MTKPINKSKVGGKFKNRVLRTIHPVVLKLLSSARKCELEAQGTVPEAEPCIFVANHFGVNDAPVTAEVVKRHVYVLVSDVDKKTAGGLAFDLNGVIWIHRTDKADRQRAHDDIVAHLKAGHSILMYPEATWNLTAELPMLQMNWGVIKIARETGVPICPIYNLFTEKTCYSKIGEPFIPTGNDAEDIYTLRDRMAALFWDLIEARPVGKREDVRPDELEISINERYDEYARARKNREGVRRYEAQFIYRPKGIAYPDEVFAPIDALAKKNN